MKTYTTDNKRVEVMKSLSENPDLVISSSSNEEVNAMMMCDAVLTNTEPGKPLNRSQVTILKNLDVGVCNFFVGQKESCEARCGFSR